MKKFRMICLDIDGTLINSDHRITEKTKNVIQRVTKELKIPTVLVSARPPSGIFFLQEELRIDGPVICYSGALIVEKPSKILFNVTIGSDWVRKIYDIARAEKVHISIYKEDKWYVEDMDKWAIQEGQIINSVPAIVEYRSLIEKWDLEGNGPNKILCMGDPKQIEKFNDRLKSENFELNVYLSKSTYLEIMPKGASKTSAIEFLKERYVVDQSEIIAIGDNYNDVDMIKFAGMGIAMGNAPDEVKIQADEITLTNDEDGAAVAIEKYILSYVDC
jgi:Cof subfamily protein (haloacid dehalogenase superfamily)